MRRAWIWLIALTTLLISGLGRILGIVAGLFVAGLVAGYLWGYHVVIALPDGTRPFEEDED